MRVLWQLWERTVNLEMCIKLSICSYYGTYTYNIVHYLIKADGSSHEWQKYISATESHTRNFELFIQETIWYNGVSIECLRPKITKKCIQIWISTYCLHKNDRLKNWVHSQFVLLTRVEKKNCFCCFFSTKSILKFL